MQLGYEWNSSQRNEGVKKEEITALCRLTEDLEEVNAGEEKIIAFAMGEELTPARSVQPSAGGTLEPRHSTERDLWNNFL